MVQWDNCFANSWVVQNARISGVRWEFWEFGVWEVWVPYQWMGLGLHQHCSALSPTVSQMDCLETLEPFIYFTPPQKENSRGEGCPLEREMSFYSWVYTFDRPLAILYPKHVMCMRWERQLLYQVSLCHHCTHVFSPFISGVWGWCCKKKICFMLWRQRDCVECLYLLLLLPYLVECDSTVTSSNSTKEFPFLSILPHTG